MEVLTRYPEVNQLLLTLLQTVQTILADQFIGMYLFGSLASGGFDEDSDIDVLVVTVDEMSGESFAALQAMHAQIYAGDSPWTVQLEVSYIPQAALRRYDPANARHPHIDRGSERFFMMAHNESWIVQRHVLRQRGVTLAGPAPQSLIDPISPTDLRRAMLAVLNQWTPQFLEEPDRLKHRGGQSYIVLTLCRILYTLHHGTVVSKHAAARWAQENLVAEWTPLIEQAWAGRHNPGLEAHPEDVNGTLAFIRFALEQGRKHETLHKRN
jgi:predicted nucleotidyltransferase